MTLQRFVSMFLVGLMFSLSFMHAPVSANSKKEKNILKVRSAVLKLGEGKDARVKVRLRDKKKLSGYIDSIGTESFTIVDEKTRATSEVRYESVRQVQGKNISTGAVVAIAIGVAVIIGIIIALSWD
ncbi:MAG TPA: hypothetical protein PKE66_14880 [Pyrinomonadaceae bacterium]|nr:hypothetical protein [Pyrinomonadaceae bacterium]